MALIYLLLVILNEYRIGLAYRYVPGPLLYFSQIAGLFPDAKDMDVEFRAEGWSCDDGLFRELDVRPFFPIQSDNKENRFERALFFYHGNSKVLASLAGYITRHQNILVEKEGGDSRPYSSGRIGGVRLVSAYKPIPALSENAVRYHRMPLSDYPNTQLRTWYETPSEIIWKRCRSNF